MDSNGNSIAANRVTSERKFEFSSIAYGTYLLKGELSGIESDVISVVVSAEHPEAKVNLTFSGKRITGLNTILEEVNAGAIYPNPVTDEAMITISTDHPVSINIELFNLMGEQVLKTNENLITGKSTLKINTGSLPGGLYTMRISSGNGINITRKLVKSE